MSLLHLYHLHRINNHLPVAAFVANNDDVLLPSALSTVTGTLAARFFSGM